MNDTHVETTVIAIHTLIRGKLHLSGSTVIRGCVEGSVASGHSLEVSATGVVEGDIDGVLVDIDGTVNGNISASGECRLGANAQVKGAVRTPSLVVADGAFFAGPVNIGVSRQEPAERVSADEDFSTAPIGAIHRIDEVPAQADVYAHIPSMGAPHNNGAQIPAVGVHAGATAGVVTQSVQQILQRGPRIIKAR